jgi:RND superfamily putative drug exporter
VNRIADLTWARPKLVLAAVGVFFLIAVAFGHDVEHHLKAAGFTDPSSESEQGSGLLSNALGYDPNPGVVLVVRAPGGGPLKLKSPALRREVDQLSGKVAQVKYIGRVVNPLQDPRAATAARWSSSATSPTATRRTTAGSPPKKSNR